MQADPAPVSGVVPSYTVLAEVWRDVEVAPGVTVYSPVLLCVQGSRIAGRWHLLAIVEAASMTCHEETWLRGGERASIETRLTLEERIAGDIAQREAARACS